MYNVVILNSSSADIINATYFSCIGRCSFKKTKNYISKRRAKTTTTQCPEWTEFYNCIIP